MIPGCGRRFIVEFEPLDELVRPNEPLRYDLEVEQDGQSAGADENGSPRD
jgi:hypothetical protein